MFDLNAMQNYVLVMVIFLVFILVLLSRQKRGGKDVAVWLFAGIVGSMLGIAGTLAAITLSGHEVVEHHDTQAEAMQGDESSGGRGGQGRGGRGGGRGRGGFDPAAIFAERDADGDGKLSGEEISERMAEDLEEIDIDGDGSVTLEEFQARMQSRFGRGGRGEGSQGLEGSAENPESGEGGDAAESGDGSSEKRPSDETE